MPNQQMDEMFAFRINSFRDVSFLGQEIVLLMFQRVAGLLEIAGGYPAPMKSLDLRIGHIHPAMR